MRGEDAEMTELDFPEMRAVIRSSWAAARDVLAGGVDVYQRRADPRRSN